MEEQTTNPLPPARISMRQASSQANDASQKLGLSNLASTILANRMTELDVPIEFLVGLKLKDLDPPKSLPDIASASGRIVRAIEEGENIAIETDHDVDGTTAHAVIHRSLTEAFGVDPNRIQHFIGLRLQEGYGISDSLCNRILGASPTPSLVITADNGSSDEPRLKRLKEAGIDVVVSDHHLMPETGTPESSYSCVTPARSDSEYPDPGIAGVMVAWLIMCTVRAEMVRRGMEIKDSSVLTNLLDYVALGTVADCVSLGASTNNRIVVNAGLRLINKNVRPCWRAMRSYMGGDEMKPISAEDLAFGIGPRVNAQGRTGDAMVAVDFFLSDDEQSAIEGAEALDIANQQRREIEKDLRAKAFSIVDSKPHEETGGLVIFLGEGHPGVHGIVASRVVESYARPTVCFSEKINDSDILTGSCRGVEGTHIRDALQVVADVYPEYMVSFGGHAMAGGVAIKREGLEAFEVMFSEAIKAQMGEKKAERVFLVDKHLAEDDDLSLADIDEVDQLGPFGRGFDKPLFSGDFLVQKAKEIGAQGGHWKMTLMSGPRLFEAIWFNAGPTIPAQTGGAARIVFELQANYWQGRRRLQLNVKHCEPVALGEAVASG